MRSILVALLGLGILLLSLISATGFVHASTTASDFAQTKVEYYLPYPGILPDSPFYKVKAVRDWISLRMTFDKEMMAQKELLFADKRINAAKSLYEGGKKELAAVVAIKAEKYLEQAFAHKAKNVETAILKHREILLEINDPIALQINSSLTPYK